MVDPKDLPLAGIVVLDFSQFLAGPVSALRLADLGARVIKIERPVTGEIGRTLAFAGRWVDGDTLSFHAMNRNKESVVADLKDPADLARVLQLVESADVLIQNFRPGVMERIGLDYEAVRRVNPGLVYASASGYGGDGPWATRPGQDLLAQAVSALPWVGATGGRPVPVGLALADHLMSCHIAEGVTALLVRRLRTGRGGLIETSLLEGMLDLQLGRLTDRLNEAPVGGRRGRSAERVTLGAPYGLYPTRDGYLAIAMAPVHRLGALVGCDELTAMTTPEAWESERARIERLLISALRRRSTHEWCELLEPEGVWCAPVLTLDELMNHPAFSATGMTQTVERPPTTPGGDPVRVATTRSPIRIDGEALTCGRAAPRLGAQGTVADVVASCARSADG